MGIDKYAFNKFWQEALQWRHNERLKSPASPLFAQLSVQTPIKENIKDLHIGFCAGTDEFPVHKASNAENVSIWWRHHECLAPDNDEPTTLLIWLMLMIYFHDFYHSSESVNTVLLGKNWSFANFTLKSVGGTLDLFHN